MSTQPDLSAVLATGSLLADLPAACIERLTPLGQSRKFPKGQTIYQKGETGDSLAVILSGQLKVCAYSASGDETVLNLLQTGDVVGEIATIDGLERTADVVAMEASELFVISRPSLLRLMESDAEFSMSLARALCLKLRAASDALEATTLDMARRTASALVRLAEQNGVDRDVEGDTQFELAIDQTTLARYAGLTRSNLNRVLKRFERAGASLHEKGLLKLYDLDWLEDFAASEE